MRILAILAVLVFLCCGCKEQKKAEPSAEETAVEALPDHIEHNNAPTAIKALRGAEEVKKKSEEQRKEESKLLQETN